MRKRFVMISNGASHFRDASRGDPADRRKDRVQLPDIHRTVIFPRTCVPYAPHRNGSLRGEEAIIASQLVAREITDVRRDASRHRERKFCYVAAHLASTLTMPFAPYHARYVHAWACEKITVCSRTSRAHHATRRLLTYHFNEMHSSRVCQAESLSKSGIEFGFLGNFRFSPLDSSGVLFSKRQWQFRTAKSSCGIKVDVRFRWCVNMERWNKNCWYLSRKSTVRDDYYRSLIEKWIFITEAICCVNISLKMRQQII